MTLKKAKETVIQKIAQYNRLLTKFQSIESKILIALIINFLWVLCGLALEGDYIIIIIASFDSTLVSLFILAVSDERGTTAIDIYLDPSRAAFYASLQGNRPILIHPLLDKSGFWQKMVSKHTNNDDLVIETISKLKTYSIVYYERERSHKDINVTD
jgi:hypothetical protein